MPRVTFSKDSAYNNYLTIFANSTSLTNNKIWLYSISHYTIYFYNHLQSTRGSDSTSTLGITSKARGKDHLFYIIQYTHGSF